jgi:predicted PurR-regulated permease PerM
LLAEQCVTIPDTSWRGAEPQPGTTPPLFTRALLGCLLGALALLCVVILRPFLVALVWAAVLVYVSWPGYRLVRRLCRQRATLAAAVMTLLVALGLIGPFSWLAILLQDQLTDFYRAVVSFGTTYGMTLPPFVRKIPWLGEAMQRSFERYAADPLLLRQLLVEWAQQSRAELFSLIGNVGRNLISLLVTLVTAFFLYRHGDGLVRQAAQVIRRFFGRRLDHYFVAAGAMTRAVVYGLLATALVQGATAGLGYWVAGVPAPLLLGVLTTLVALIPFGTPVVWGSIGIWLLLNGRTGAGLGLLLWGGLVVSTVDNLIRPMVISSATRLPFLLVMFGVLGGLAAFGLIGLFVGPVALAVATAVWREWLEEHGEPPR